MMHQKKKIWTRFRCAAEGPQTFASTFFDEGQFFFLAAIQAEISSSDSSFCVNRMGLQRRRGRSWVHQPRMGSEGDWRDTQRCQSLAFWTLAAAVREQAWDWYSVVSRESRQGGAEEDAGPAWAGAEKGSVFSESGPSWVSAAARRILVPGQRIMQEREGNERYGKPRGE